ncbi:MAG: hypothetical protein QOH81_1212 [Sphingomonadales bacterium]|nr:hypothetical protein [Sphingomonadales bacterium]
MRVFLPRATKCLEHNLKNPVHVRQHVAVPKAENAETLRSEILITRTIAFGRMLPPVSLDDQLILQATEVDDVRGDCPLPAEFVPAQPPATQFAPQHVLGVGCVAPERRSVWADGSADDPHAEPDNKKKTLTQPSPASGRGVVLTLPPAAAPPAREPRRSPPRRRACGQSPRGGGVRRASGRRCG